MEYVVIRSFTDKDTQIHYAVGDKYPRRGYVVKARIAELLSENNKRGVALIAEVKSESEPVVEEYVEKEEPEKKETFYTRTDINTMPVSKLRKFAKENGIDNADNISGTKLKELLIEKMGL